MMEDFSKGYSVMFHANEDGTYSVGEPMAHSEDNAEPEGETIAELPAALKVLLNMVKSHPVGESDQAQFQAGYGAEPKSPEPADLSMPA